MIPSRTTPRVLVVDDEPDLRTLYELTLVRQGYDVDSAADIAQARARLAEHAYELLITDLRLPDGSGLELLALLESTGRSERALVITAYSSTEGAVEALKAGAYDYLTKPVDLRQFRTVVASALGRGEPAPRRAQPAAGRTSALERLAGASAAMQQVRELVLKVSRSMAPVLVQGESGTGKELVARAIHEVSARADKNFVAVNCGAIPEPLLEAEFFGYRKGAFTGANEDRDGFFQAAHGGTLFLDEIGDLPLPMQSKLLRSIQERVVRPVGAVAETALDVRIVSATHKDLGHEVRDGRFRQDLYYRLNVIGIHVPPLRERIADLPAICTAVLARIARDAGVTPPPTLTDDALRRLLGYRYPGNVRELENLLHRALALSGADRIDAADLGLGDDEPIPEAVPVGAAPAARASASLPSDLQAHLDAIERDILERALTQHRFNRTAAGASLALTLRQMRYRMARLGIDAGGSGADGERGKGGA